MDFRQNYPQKNSGKNRCILFFQVETSSKICRSYFWTSAKSQAKPFKSIKNTHVRWKARECHGRIRILKTS